MIRGKWRRSLELIEASIEILEEIQPATVRAICYQLFALGLIDSMSKNNTNKVGRQLTDARELGWLPWSGSSTRPASSRWSRPGRTRRCFADTVTRSYRRTSGRRSPSGRGVSREGHRPRDAGPVLDLTRQPSGSCTASRARRRSTRSPPRSRRTPQPLVALYVDDWDPSGLHMSEVDLPQRIDRYRAHPPGGARQRRPLYATAFDIDRVARTDEDVADPALPSFSVESKRGDPRWTWFVEQYGRTCRELDALVARRPP